MTCFLLEGEKNKFRMELHFFEQKNAGCTLGRSRKRWLELFTIGSLEQILHLGDWKKLKDNSQYRIILYIVIMNFSTCW